MRTVVLFLAPVMLLQGCGGESRAGLKFLNDTETEVEVKSVQLNEKQVSLAAIILPPRTAQKYSPKGHVPHVSVADKDKLSATFHRNGASIRASCVIPTHSGGICLAHATYSGGEILRCWYDCEEPTSK